MRNFVAPLIKLVIFLVVTSFATYVLAATIANTSYGDTNTYNALFTSASGIQEGDDVRVAGVRVGSITGIKLVRDDKTNNRIAEVSFTVVKSRPLPQSVEATIRYRNLVGQRYLDVSQGAAGDSTAQLKAGGTIPVNHTNPALDLTVLFQGFQPLVKGLNAGEINTLSQEIIDSLQGEGGAIDALFGTVADLTNSLADKDQVIGDLITNLSSTLTTVAQHDQDLTNLIMQLRRFVSGFAADRETIGNAIDGVNKLATTTSGLLTQVRPPLAKDIKDLTGLVGVLNQHSSDITYVINNIPTTVAALIRTATYGSWFNFYLCALDGTITLPTGNKDIHLVPSAQPRCN